MKKKLLSVAILSAVTTTAYAADWNDVQQSFDAAPTTSVIQDVREAIKENVGNKGTVTFSTDTQVGANNQSSEALSSNVTSTDWLKNINDEMVSLGNRATVLEIWTGAGGFTSALDLHTQLSNDIDVVDTDLQAYKVDTDEELNRHETALQSATTYTGTLASAMTATADNVAANSIGSAQIKNGSIKSSDIKDGAVGNDQLASDAVTSDKVLDGSLTGDDVADGGLTGSDIQDGSLTGTDVAADSITGTHVTGITGADVTDGSLTGIDMQDGSITGLDIADNSLTGNDVLDSSLEMNDLSSAAQSSLGSGGSSEPTALDREIYNYVKGINKVFYSGSDNNWRRWKSYRTNKAPYIMEVSAVVAGASSWGYTGTLNKGDRITFLTYHSQGTNAYRIYYGNTLVKSGSVGDPMVGQLDDGASFPNRGFSFSSRIEDVPELVYPVYRSDLNFPL